VATDAGSITEVISHDLDGLITQQRDAIGLADAIEALIRNPERRLRMGREAARKIRKNFDVDVCERWFHERITRVVAK
jgi:glycosyltransferase involved in cell wall biosynthesis